MNIWICHEDSIKYLPFFFITLWVPQFAMEEMAAIEIVDLLYLSKFMVMFHSFKWQARNRVFTHEDHKLVTNCGDDVWAKTCLIGWSIHFRRVDGMLQY